MVHSLPIAVAAASLLLPAAHAFYDRSSPVIQADGGSFNTLVNKSNYTSIVEFYAPWCGHCQNLKPAYEKAAKSLSGLAKVVAVNCDEEPNKPLCGRMGVQGFPTLKIVRPGKKPGKPFVEDYRGERTAKAIVDAVIDKIPSHVKRLKDADYEAWVAEDAGPKAILFTNKGTVSPLLKAIAIDFLGGLGVAQIRDKEKGAVEAFGVEKFPTLVLLPGDGKETIPYVGEMKKDSIVKFLSQAATPNPDPPRQEKKKQEKKKQEKKPKSTSTKSSSNPNQSGHVPGETGGSKPIPSPSSTPIESGPVPGETGGNKPIPSPSSTPIESGPVPGETGGNKPIPSPSSTPIESGPVPGETGGDKPIPTPSAAASKPDATSVALLAEPLAVQQKCLNDKAGTCVIVLLPEENTPSESTTLALKSLSEVQQKYDGRKLFPFFQVPHANAQNAALRTTLELNPGKVEIIAINGKRSWFRHFTAEDFHLAKVEDWVDAIRMGESPKKKVPDSLIVDAAELPSEPVVIEDPEQVKQKETTPDPDSAVPDADAARKIVEQLKADLPEGLTVQIEELEDADYEKMMKEGEAEGKSKESEAETAVDHDEL
ncbi:thioredoxin-domain-containing protein [Sphaerulina musiva SO2202]|uniref:protein disulfide-isomerase n=1 Tax=Sphaerulina musiva (strain SO2202) TaxID=692275 RepID=M3D670_SPHMS|nr:thioredoxin-domain-containing protein [Sphaerulina musiva SO2202]EMF13675.1 thioredoxin-domain-containing protein [Sphaerulina musiva SO2202]